MKTCKRMLCMVLAALLFAGALPISAAQDITLTAVNDSFLSLSSSTMPTRKNGELYVPYSVFSSLGLHSTYSDKQQLLIIYNWDYTLNFSLSQGYVYDQDDKSYSPPAYFINGTVYVPVKLVCGIFGLSYSTISAAYPVLRIVNDNAALSDHSFVANNADTIDRMVTAYLNAGSTGGQTTPGGPTEPVSPVQPPKAEEKIPQPSRVYFAFTGTPTENTASILDTLSNFGRTATFFLSPKDLSNGDLIRRIVSEGHSIGLSFTADESLAAPEELIALLSSANEQLLYLCGVQTRLAFVENGADALSQTQRNALVDAGYRIWDSTLDARDDSRSAYRAAEVVLKAFQQSNALAVIRLRQGKNSADALAYILRYMRDTSISHAVMHHSTTPMNNVNDIR